MVYVCKKVPECDIGFFLNIAPLLETKTQSYTAYMCTVIKVCRPCNIIALIL